MSLIVFFFNQREDSTFWVWNDRHVDNPVSQDSWKTTTTAFSVFFVEDIGSQKVAKEKGNGTPYFREM